MTLPRVSLLGLGRMGEPIAGRLLTALGSLTIWNRTAVKGERLRAAGASIAPTPAQAAADITLTVLTDLADLRQILDGPDGLLAGWASVDAHKPVLIVHGTVSPVGAADLARELAAVGIQVIDAPLSGGVAGAESGELSVMVGGATEAVERAWPILNLIGHTVRHLGNVGSGQTAKACNQVVVAANVAAMSEALVLADATGIDRAQLMELLAGGLANSEVLRQKRDRWIAHDFTGGGSSANQLKDLHFVAEAAATHGFTLPLASTLRAMFQRAIDDGDGALDHSGIELSIARHAAERTD